MTPVLRLDASARLNGSLSRALADTFLDALSSTGLDIDVTRRDVGLEPPPAMSELWMAAAFKPEADRSDRERAALALSDTLIEEVRRSALIVIATPMYNYGMPAALKAWIDQVVRINETFSFDRSRGDFPLEPILSGKTLVLLTACGEFGFEPGGVRDGQGHLAPHMRTVSKYLGVERFETIAIEYQEFGDDRHEQSVRRAHAGAAELARAIAEASPAMDAGAHSG